MKNNIISIPITKHVIIINMIFIGSDHRGFTLKKNILSILRGNNVTKIYIDVP